MPESPAESAALATPSPSIPALLLLPGDPLPPLPVTPPLPFERLAGQWVLILSCGLARVPELGGLVAALAGPRRCAVRVLLREVSDIGALPEVGDAGRGGDLVSHGDLDGRAADALGALEGRQGRADVAVLVDPRSDVQRALVWHDTASLVRSLLDVLRR